ncbi:MAG: ATP-binding protein [Syntrophobacteraceae bacterium]
MYAAFARLNYRPWYALAEFVDNSLQSALSNMNALQTDSGGNYKLIVEVCVEDDCIEVRDNAAGINERDYANAFLPASPPSDTSGLSEFGLGMKVAASWFARLWSVRTSALGEPIERTITFDIPKIVETNCEHLEPVERSISANEHFTTVSLRDLQVRPRGRTMGKISDHLRSIYRIFLRNGLMELRLNGEALKYEPPTFLYAPFHATPMAEHLTWRKEIELNLGDGHRVRGWAAILARASVANAGFAIFRRGRLIQGSHGEGYRPEVIFGKPNKFAYQRIVGELEVEGFSVTHTKDGVQWEDWEDDILSWVRDKLDEEPLPLLDQAENYRARAIVNRDIFQEATRDTTRAIAQHLPPIIDQQINSEPIENPLPRELDEVDEEPTRSEQVELHLDHAQRDWTVKVELIYDVSHDGWYEIAEGDTNGETTMIHIRVNLGHPFMVRFVSSDGYEIVPFTRLAAALAIAEITAREVGVRQAGTLRMNLNQILRTALSGPIQRGEIRHAE